MYSTVLHTCITLLVCTAQYFILVSLFLYVQHCTSFLVLQHIVIHLIACTMKLHFPSSVHITTSHISRTLFYSYFHSNFIVSYFLATLAIVDYFLLYSLLSHSLAPFSLSLDHDPSP
ncbi:hypothetical protein CLIB1423_22S01486 [[Candida] railenensis]|uniref:Uncharacterized protein n=1 Tax=[Candida] railenensis TaxID=45579 RepID=A0A9P0W100_9ASCO|nr:hypothetical protein CLIB1423_22S01486 [[Candida] railenensis]